MKISGFYTIKDEFFEEMNDIYLKGNKNGNRPHYYCFKEESSNIFWIIPLSSKIEKYKKIINDKLKLGKPCDILYVCKLDNDKESAFLIQDMFPITENYIEKEYTLQGNHLFLTSEHSVKEINIKAKKVLALIKQGIKFTPTQPNVMIIFNKLKNKELVNKIR